VGADVALVADRREAQECAARLTDGIGIGVVVETGGTAEAVQTALDIVSGGGALATLGLARATEMDALTVMRKNLLWIGVVASVRRHYAEAIRLIRTGKVQPDRLITHRLPLADAASALPAMRDAEAVKIMFAPGA
jgi:threonine dehydrogenase-like Zn-dependent dehydrogenase